MSKSPDISPESFAVAMAAFLKNTTPKATKTVSHLVGTWQRQENGKTYYYRFQDDGTLETNETNVGGGLLKGRYDTADNTLQLEPHDQLCISNLSLSVTGKQLHIQRTDGKAYDYAKKTM